MTPRELLALIREKEVRAVDLRFMDFPGLWKHCTIPAATLEESTFEEGVGFDGSSIRGWTSINESDMLVLPAADTAFLDPFARDKTLVLICNIHDPLTKEEYTRNPRNVARKAVNYMRNTGLADAALFGPGAGVLRLRRRPLRPDPALRLLFPRQCRGRLEHRPRRGSEPRPQAAHTAKAISPAHPPTLCTICVPK